MKARITWGRKKERNRNGHDIVIEDYIGATMRIHSFIWIAVKELELSHYNKETLLSNVYPYYGNLV